MVESRLKYSSCRCCIVELQHELKATGELFIYILTFTAICQGHGENSISNPTRLGLTRQLYVPSGLSRSKDHVGHAGPPQSFSPSQRLPSKRLRVHGAATIGTRAHLHHTTVWETRQSLPINQQRIPSSSQASIAQWPTPLY